MNTDCERPDDATTHLRLSSPEDLLDMVGYLLGFEPSESIVFVFIGHGRIVNTARVDIAAAKDIPFMRRLSSAVRSRTGATEAVIVVYCGDERRGRRAARRAKRALGARLRESLLVIGDHFWLDECDDPMCCPPGGRSVASGPSRIDAEAVFAGMSKRASREDLARSIAGPQPGDALAETRRAVDAAATRPTTPGWVAGQLTAGEFADCGDQEVARAILACQPMEELASLVCDIGPENAREHLRLWERAVQLSPPEYAANVLVLLGTAAWASGEGAIVSLCLERLDAEDPHHPWRRRLEATVLDVIPPGRGRGLWRAA